MFSMRFSPMVLKSFSWNTSLVFLDLAVHLLVYTVVVFVVVENLESLLLEVLVAEPDGRDESGGLTDAVRLPEGETPLEECLGKALVDTGEFGSVVGYPEDDFSLEAAFHLEVGAVAGSVEHDFVAFFNELLEFFAELFGFGLGGGPDGGHDGDADGGAGSLGKLTDLNGSLLEVVHGKAVIAQDEFLLLAGALFGGLDIQDVLVLFHAGTCLLVVLVEGVVLFFELLGDE